MRLSRRFRGTAIQLGVLGLVATLAIPMTILMAADHLDSPAVSGRPDVDINDVYAFAGSNSNNTVLIMTLSPVASATTRFGAKENTRYVFRVDQDGDAIEELAFAVEFIDQDNEAQRVHVRRVQGDGATSRTPVGRLVGNGLTGATIPISGGGRLTTGLFSDPFFFDLSAFRDDVEMGNLGNGNDLGDGVGNDFFEDLNTLAIVLEVPKGALGDNIGVWATTSALTADGWIQADRLGRPAINTVINSTGAVIGDLGGCTGDKSLYNRSLPKNDPVDFIDEAACALTVLSSLDAEGAYTADQLGVLASVLLPDILPFHRTGPVSDLPAPLNGRALANDVIDVELRVVTGGDPLDLFGVARDADGAINSDDVGPHGDYRSVFPYLGVPHS
ncbi:MAG: DUF4331 family protein [Acidimicrobiia bacterium]